MPYCSICGNETIAIPFSDYIAHVCNTVGCQHFAQGGNYERIGGEPEPAGIQPFTTAKATANGNGNNGHRPAHLYYLGQVYRENYDTLRANGASSTEASYNRSDVRTAAWLAKAAQSAKDGTDNG